MIDYTTCTNEELENHYTALNKERTRRQGLDTVYQEIGAVLNKARAQGVIETPAIGEPWEPGKVYGLGDVVTDQEQRYESLHPFNVWAPGDESNPVHWTLWKLLAEPETGDTGYLLWSGLGVDYVTGDVVEFEGELYQIVQAHTSQPGWEPPTVPALWEHVVASTPIEPAEPTEPGDGVDEDLVVPEYVAPTGGHNAYNTGDRVLFESNVYESMIDGNTWSPTDYPQGWELIDGDGE